MGNSWLGSDLLYAFVNPESCFFRISKEKHQTANNIWTPRRQHKRCFGSQFLTAWWKGVIFDQLWRLYCTKRKKQEPRTMSSCCFKDTSHYINREQSQDTLQITTKKCPLCTWGWTGKMHTRANRRDLPTKKMNPLYCTFLEQSEPCIDKWTRKRQILVIPEMNIRIWGATALLML